MAKPDEREDEEEIQLTWGTWEELLLASAVHRHGINCWDSVAYEIRKRSSVPGHLLTPINCERRYLDLRKRYTPGDDDDRADTEIPWLEELRKLRVAELRKEVERYDISIASLQLKVKKLKEEHEQSLKEVNEDEQKSDLEKNKEMRGDEDEIDRSPDENPSMDKIDRGNQSVNGSNSTDQRIIKRESSKGADKIEENSCNGSSDSVEKEPVIESTKIETELLESVAESKDGDGAGAGTEEADDGRVEESTDNSSNDEQSLAGHEPEKEDQSPAITIKSKRLIDFLEIIRSNKLFSMFERRLKSQETLHYRSLIKQHMDLETIRTRLDEGWYGDTNSKFFRDFLLIIGNAFVFFGKKSTEYPASIELLSLVLKEMSKGLSSDELEQKETLIQKPKSPTPIIVCRKRSSISAKPSASSKDTTSLKGKPIINQKQAKPSSKIEEEQTKKKVKDNKSSQQRTGKGSSSLVKQPNPSLSNRNNTNTNSKKQNPTISVNRSKRNSSTDDGLLLDKLKNLSSISDSSKSGGGDQKRNGKGNGSKGQASKISTNWGQQIKEKECLAKQQKPLAAPAKLSNLSGKRGREGGDTQAAASKQSKKRPRK